VIETLYIPEHNICIVKSDDIIHQALANSMLQLYHYKLHDYTKINKDIKNILLHFLFLHVCKFLSEQKIANKVVLHFSTTTTFFFNGKDDVTAIVHKNLKKMHNILPIRVYFDDRYSFETVKSLLSEPHTGNCKEFVCNIKNFTESRDFSNFTFSKVKNFVKRKKLFYIDENLFTTLKGNRLLLV